MTTPLNILKVRVLSEIPVARVWNMVTGQEIIEGEDIAGIHCPFHGTGEDSKPSAKIFGDTDNSVWCWSCQKKMDAITLVRLRHGVGFASAVHELAKLLSDGGASATIAAGPVIQKEDAATARRLEVMEKLLLSRKFDFDAASYCAASVLMDRAYAAVKAGKDVDKHMGAIMGVLDG